MGRTLNSEFEPVQDSSLGQGVQVVASVENAVAANVNWVHANACPARVLTHWLNESGGIWYTGLKGTAASQLRAAWRFRAPLDWPTYRIHVAYSADGSMSTSATLLVKDAAGSTLATATLLTGTTLKWATVDFDLVAPSGDLGDVWLWLQDGTGGHVSLYSVMVHPVPRASISAGVQPSGFVPLDSVELAHAAGAPLPIHVRQLELDDLQLVTESTTTGIVGWSDDLSGRASDWAYYTGSTSYVLKVRAPFTTLTGQSTAVRWSLTGYGPTGSKAKLYTASMVTQGIAAVEVALPATSWTTPATSVPWADSAAGSTELVCAAGGEDVLFVELKAGSGTAYLLGLTAWVRED